MNIKSLFVLGIMLLGILAFSGVASAIDAQNSRLQILEVELDEDTLDASSTNEIMGVDKGDEFEIKVHLKALADIDDLQIEAYIRGYDHDDLIEDITDVFDMRNGTKRTKKLTLKLPKRMDRDGYKLRVTAADRNGDTLEVTYDLDIDVGRHDIAIRDVILSPANGVKAGRALLATVRVRNYGSREEDDVKVTFSIPELGVAASDYIDELAEDGDKKDSKSTEELYLRIPACVDAGTYEAIVEVEYEDGDEVTRKVLDVEVFEDETCGVAPIGGGEAKPVEKTVITIGPESQDITKGAGGVMYPVTITNPGNKKTYVISVTAGDWGTFRVSPTNVVTVDKDETETVYIYAVANDDAPAGEQVFGVAIKSGDKTIDEVTLKANVLEGKAVGIGGLKRVMEIGLIVLVVILVILALIIGFNKLKGNEEEEKKGEGESYY